MKVIAKVDPSDWLDSDFQIPSHHLDFSNEDWAASNALSTGHSTSVTLSAFKVTNEEDALLLKWLSTIKPNQLTKKMQESLASLLMEVETTKELNTKHDEYLIEEISLPTESQSIYEFGSKSLLTLPNIHNRRYYAHEMRYGTFISGEIGEVIPSITIDLSTVNFSHSYVKDRSDTFRSILDEFGFIYPKDMLPSAIPPLDPPQIYMSWVDKNLELLTLKYDELFAIITEHTGHYNLVMQNKDRTEKHIENEIYIDVIRYFYPKGSDKSLLTSLVDLGIELTTSNILEAISLLSEEDQSYLQDLADDSKLATTWTLRTPDGTSVGTTKDPRIAEDWVNCKYYMKAYPSKRGRVKLPLSVISLCLSKRHRDNLIGSITTSELDPYLDENFNSRNLLLLRKESYYDKAQENYILSLLQEDGSPTTTKNESSTQRYLSLFLNQLLLTGSQLSYLRSCLKSLGELIVEVRQKIKDNSDSIYSNLFPQVSKKLYSWINHCIFYKKQIPLPIYKKLLSGSFDLCFKFVNPDNEEEECGLFSTYSSLSYKPKVKLVLHESNITPSLTFNIIRNYRIQPSILKEIENNVHILCPDYNSVSHLLN